MAEPHDPSGETADPTSDLASAYDKLTDQVDRFFAEVHARNRHRMQCGAGCAQCCQHRLSFFPIEAERVITAVKALDAGARAAIAARAESDSPACPLLGEDERCTIYEARPIICRSQGLPLLIPSEDDETEPAGVDICPLNFTEATEVDGEDVLDLVTLNQALATLHSVQQHELPGDHPDRGRLRVTVEEIVTRAT